MIMQIEEADLPPHIRHLFLSLREANPSKQTYNEYKASTMRQVDDLQRTAPIACSQNRDHRTREYDRVKPVRHIFKRRTIMIP